MRSERGKPTPRVWSQARDGPSHGLATAMGGARAKSACPRLIAIRRDRRSHWDLMRASSQVEIDPHLVSPVPAAQCSRAVAQSGTQNSASGDSFPHSPAKAGRPRRIDPADH